MPEFTQTFQTRNILQQAMPYEIRYKYTAGMKKVNK
jgi:hypothetical protein